MFLTLIGKVSTTEFSGEISLFYLAELLFRNCFGERHILRNLHEIFELISWLSENFRSVNHEKNSYLYFVIYRLKKNGI